MSNKYHVNPYTYKVMPCSAQIKCEYADHPDIKHFDKNSIDDALVYAEELGAKSHNKIQTLRKGSSENSINKSFAQKKQEWNNRKENLSPEAQHSYVKDRAKEIIMDSVNLKEKNKKEYASFANDNGETVEQYNDYELRVRMIGLHNENRKYLNEYAYLMSKEDIRNMVDVQNKIRMYFPNFSQKDDGGVWDSVIADVYGDDNRSYEEITGLDEQNISSVNDEALSEQEMKELRQTVTIVTNSALDYPSSVKLSAKAKELQKAFILRKPMKTNNVSNILDRFNDFKDFESKIMHNKTAYEDLSHSYHMIVKNYNFKKVRAALSNS